MNSLRIGVLMLFCAVFLNGFAEKNLASTSWKLWQVQCKAVASDVADQAYVDSSLAYLQKTQVTGTDAFECEFTETELVRRTKGDAGHWKYKFNGSKLIVDFGNGKMYILDVKSFTEKDLVLGLDKKRFFISDRAPKDETLPSLIQSLDLEFIFKLKE
ncbi:MAG: hypothetical protein MJZ33_12665 [Paludibacteraceae bacterium]|nr:hypothetical protein [Paludibacteraceae bacterium]